MGGMRVYILGLVENLVMRPMADKKIYLWSVVEKMLAFTVVLTEKYLQSQGCSDTNKIRLQLTLQIQNLNYQVK